VFPESLVLEVPLVSKDLKDFLELKGQQEKPDQRVTEDFRDQWDNEVHQDHRYDSNNWIQYIKFYIITHVEYVIFLYLNLHIHVYVAFGIFSIAVYL
jgi:hypothetical protein